MTHVRISRLGRRAAAFAAGVVVLAAGPLAVAAAAAPPPPPSTSDFCANAPSDSPFTDIDGNAHEENIICLAFSQITTGTTATTFDPNDPVTRGQMATFVARLIDTANDLEIGDAIEELPAYDGDNDFVDADDDDVHTPAINRLADVGIALGDPGGIGDDRFAPGDDVTRGQMASFLNRAQEFMTGDGFDVDDDFFTDDESSVHEANINAIASAGVAQGITATTYRPEDSVVRGQMASFLVRLLAVNEANGLITPLPAPVAALVDITVDDTDSNGILSPGDEIVLTFDAPVVTDSSITVDDVNDGDHAILTDDAPLPEDATPATFTVSEDGTEVTVVVGTPLTVIQTPADPGDGVIDGDIAVIDCDGIFTDNDDDGEVSEGDEAVECDADVDGLIPEAIGQTGTITALDADADTYTFVAEGDDAATTVEYDSDDVFTIDGDPATLAAFEAALDVGDEVTFIDDATDDDNDQHALVNNDPSAVSSGTVGNVDTGAGTFVIIDPVSGVALSDVKTYTGALYEVDGAAATVASFEADVNEGDTVVIVTDDEGEQTFQLTNAGVTGTVTSVDADADLVTIDALGDDPMSAQDAAYNYVAGAATNVYTVDGDEVDLAEFEVSLSEGDELSYERENDTQTFNLTNVAPPAEEGTATESVDAAADVFTMVQGGDDLVVDYSGVEAFVVDGLVSTVGEFEDAYSAGDAVSFTPDDPGTPTNESRIVLDNETLAGAIADVDTAADTYDVVNADGGVIYDDLVYTGAVFGGDDDYFVNGTEVTLADFELFLEEVAADATPDDTISVVDNGDISTQHFLQTDETIA